MLPRPQAQEAAATVRERRLVAAALSPADVLAAVPSRTPPRGPVSPAALRRGHRLRVPVLFSEGYVAYQESCRERQGRELEETESEGSIASADSPSQERSPGLRSMRLRVMPWHREALHKMLCKSVLKHFLQVQREALGLNAHQPPLSGWEARRAQEHTAAGQVVVLVKYLAETELHIRLGPERRGVAWESGARGTPGSAPGSSLGAAAVQRLRAERRELAREWGVYAQTLEEDAVVRIFLDGCLTWERLRALLGLDRLLEAASEGQKSSAKL
eukprot:gnl/TRDRNA2_/TRDRNA2_59794_c0_seq1.p1 gnl/TRDRNA2_/TRDRNA2_59794_c0~~gnl/TRDRNA2_/TRDRNA2_59794_c0_seq1.p1  ORF type:complete len:308 (-),score=54.98 gnl/TRDRNA2_/TRDRNA2_59794_c0_seq1:81-899(-)